ncbi:MAG: carboxypeptidase regulatory-like domain-containing protein, partial [Bryobacteraceae bacterium]
METLLKNVATVMVTLLLPCSLLGQAARGTITGAVRDSSGAVIPNARVVVMGTNTGVQVETVTQANGVYLVPQLQPGDYGLTVEASGFKRLSVASLKVDVGSTLTQDAVLEIGQVSETLEVTSEASRVDTTSGQVGTSLQVTHVLEMPFADRNVFNLINLVPGAFFAGAADDPANQHMANVSVGGSRFQNTQALLDGVSNTRGGLGIGNVEVAPPVDSVQEFKVQVSSMSAEYGRGTGGLVSAVTRSGTNKFHGTFYEYLRNDVFDALGWGNDSQPPLRRNNFGATIGGPIRRNQTFFFYTYDGLRSTTPTTRTRDVGLPEWRRGDFSTATRDAGGRAALVPIYDPDTGTGTFGAPRDTLVFPGNVIPAARLDPVAVKAVAYLPNANRAPNNPFNNTGNWQANQRRIFRRDFNVGRIDHQFSNSTKLFGRFVISRPERHLSEYLEGWGPADQNGNDQSNRRQNLAASLTHVFSPRLFLNFTAGYNRVDISNAGGDCCDKNYAELLGIRNAPGGETFPAFQIGGGLVPVAQIGSGGPNRLAGFTNVDFNADFTRISGSHTLKFGAQHSRSYAYETFRQRPSGAFGFDGHFTRGVTATGAAVANSGINMADFLLGRLNSVDANVSDQFNKRLQYYGGYLQDDWRISGRLTLNLGLRYETQTPDYEVNGMRSNFDIYAANPRAGTGDVPAGARGAFTFQNRNGSGKYLYRWPQHNFEPRFGFAYRLTATGTTVLRGGYGIFFGTPTPNGTLQEGKIGFGKDYSARNPVPYRLVDGIPAGAVDIVPVSELTLAFGSRGTRFEQSAVSAMDPYQPSQYTQNLNFNVQHEWSGILFEVGYLGNLSRQVISNPYNINLIPPELLSRTEIPERLRRPFTTLGSNQASVSLRFPSGGFSNYHAMTVKVERRFRTGFSWIAAYTLSKWIDDVPFTSNTGATPFGDNDAPQNIYDRRNERSLATNHIPHRLVFSPIVELPFGKGKRWLDRGGVANAVLGGWQISTLATLQKGAPFGVAILNGGRDILGDTTATLRPNLVGNPNASNQGEPAGNVRGLYWLDPAAFANPARFTHGTASRTLPGTLGPGIVDFDDMVAKSIQ